MRKQFQKEFMIISISFTYKLIFLMLSKKAWRNASQIRF
jgi:hypothetical protein